MIYYVLDEKLNTVRLIEKYSSMIWTERYYEAGDFELCIPADPEAFSFFVSAAKKHYYIVKDDPKQNTRSMTAMIIYNVKLEDYSTEHDILVITGKCLKSLASRRVVSSGGLIAGNVQEAVQALVLDHMVNPKDSVRAFSRIIIENDKKIDAITNATVAGMQLDEAIETLVKEPRCGWDIRLNLDDKKFVFTMYKGIDRSLSQPDIPNEDKNPYVIFSNGFDNLSKTTFVMSTENLKNVAYVSSEYLETDAALGRVRKIDFTQSTGVKGSGRQPTGFDRFELFVDGSSVANESNSVNTNSLRRALLAKGVESLDGYEDSVEVSGEVVPDLTFKINVDYYLGDLVSVVNEYDKRFDARVTEVTESISTTEESLIPTFEIEWWDDKPDDEEDEYKDSEARITESGEYIQVSSGAARIITIGPIFENRVATIADNSGVVVDEDRITEDGTPIVAAVSEIWADL